MGAGRNSSYSPLFCRIRKAVSVSCREGPPSARGNNLPYIKKPRQATQDYFERFFGGRPQLTNLHIEITSKCNERCVHCYIPHENKYHSMGSDLFYDILEQRREMNLLHLTISGGEPMLHRNFIDFLRKCNEYNFSVNVLSNLTMLNDAKECK